MDTQVQYTNSQDPRLLRELVNRAQTLALEHGLCSVLVGLSGFEGDPGFPALIDYIESSLRVDDRIFRLTRERVLLLLTDVDDAGARAIVARLFDEYAERCPTTAAPAVGVGTFQVDPETRDASLKAVLPAVFASPPKSH